MKLTKTNAFRLKHINTLTFQNIRDLSNNFDKLSDEQKIKVANIIYDTYQKTINHKKDFQERGGIFKRNKDLSEKISIAYIFPLTTGSLSLIGLASLCCSIAYNEPFGFLLSGTLFAGGFGATVGGILLDSFRNMKLILSRYPIEKWRENKTQKALYKATMLKEIVDNHKSVNSEMEGCENETYKD